MVAPRIATSPVKVLSEQERNDLLTLHEACKAARKSEDPYQFDWLIELLRRPTQVHTIEVRMDTAIVTMYAADGEMPSLPPGA